MNGEHGQIYKKIDETRKEITKNVEGNNKEILDKLDSFKDNLSELNSSITEIHTKLNTFPCSSNTNRLRITENKIASAEGGVKLFSILLVITSLIAIIIKILGLW